jgi:cyclophilin family peptidyl-prolyl cis-trans isomerase
MGMKKYIRNASALVVMIAFNSTPASATSPVPTPVVKAPEVPSPSEIVAAAPAQDWTAIAPSDLLVMDLAADSRSKPRRVVIQLIPAPVSQGWVNNIRKLAKANWWDGTAIVRVQDNYVTQWGDATEKKPLPQGLATIAESDYETPEKARQIEYGSSCHVSQRIDRTPVSWWDGRSQDDHYINEDQAYPKPLHSGPFFSNGWPFVGVTTTSPPKPKLKYPRETGCNVRDIGEEGVVGSYWPVHCYGMVGVGRNLSPDTGTGAELYTVIGHAPRHLDRNIALVGRIIEGMEHMSSLPRGTGALGFYETPEERTKIESVRLMSEMGNDKPLPAYEYLSTDSASFAKYADARANRRDPFFIKPAGGADICNIPVPVRRVKHATR